MIFSIDYFVKDFLEVINHVNLFRYCQSSDNMDTHTHKKKRERKGSFPFGKQKSLTW